MRLGACHRELSQEQFLEVPRLILSQLQFLDFVMEGEVSRLGNCDLSHHSLAHPFLPPLSFQELCSKLLEVIDSVPEVVQRDIISCLPMALDDQNHEFAAKKLR